MAETGGGGGRSFFVGAQIKVSTDVLNEKAEQVLRCIKNMDNTFRDLETTINRTNYYWIGEAGDLHRKLYQNQKDVIDEMMRRLKEHPTDLQTIAQTYVAAEKEITGIARELPGDVIR